VLASLIVHVGDFDLAEESTRRPPFAIALRLPATPAMISRWVFSVAHGPANLTDGDETPQKPMRRLTDVRRPISVM
jgi:hypothetical protein